MTHLNIEICTLFYCRELKGRKVYLMEADAWDLLNMPVDEAIDLFDELYKFLNKISMSAVDIVQGEL
jgi:hypothetical protein